MTQEDKELLLKDISARLPYGVKFPTKICCEATHDIIDVVRTIQSINSNGTCRTEEGNDCDFSFAWSVRPYLFPISSITEEQKKELRRMDAFVNAFDQICFYTYYDYGHALMPTIEDVIRITNWLNKNHFDYRGLLEKGLAIDATGLNVY